MKFAGQSTLNYIKFGFATAIILLAVSAITFIFNSSRSKFLITMSTLLILENFCCIMAIFSEDSVALTIFAGLSMCFGLSCNFLYSFKYFLASYNLKYIVGNKAPSMLTYKSGFITLFTLSWLSYGTFCILLIS